MKRPARKRSTPVESSRATLERSGDRRSTESGFPIVGVGASAGGLEAFSELLHQIAEHDAGHDDGMALVLIQHLDPTHTSFLREALVKTTKLPVQQAEDGMRVEPGHVYVIPPNASLGIRGGRLTLAPRPLDPKVKHLPIDAFFRELAAERGGRAIGVVLSGTASDGTNGLQAIKEANGITFAQEPSSAKFSGMPRSAVDAGVVDYCLPVPALAKELVRITQHPYVIAPESAPSLHDAATLDQIIALVRAVARVDFGEYKTPTFERRLARRMALRRIDTIDAYLQLLQQAPDEVWALFEDTLIHVTSFFRDPEVFEHLKTNVFPAIVKGKPEGASLRLWVPGCATGEEVYSLGIALAEFLGESSRSIQIFGSDVSGKAIETARAGFYPEAALRHLSDERRRRYFTKVDRGYRIAAGIREQCVFVQHDLARDPPFSKVDLVSCRNVLIYFDQALQKRVVPTFHYALNQPGFLLLGRAENIAGFTQLFQTFDKANKTFARTSVPSTLRFAQRSEVYRQTAAAGPRGRPRERHAVMVTAPPPDLSRRLDRLLLARYAPAGIVVNEKMEILEFRGQTGAYLEPAPGEPQNNLMLMAREGLSMTLRAAMAKAKKTAVAVRVAGVEVGQNSAKQTCDVVVIPLLGVADHAMYVILFEEQALSGQQARSRARPKETPREGRRLPKVESELAATKEYLQAVIAEHGRTNEDLGTANEELVSGNEELQSMNEELETAKEELQSINEELTTVNDELQTRNHEVTQINGDLVNLLTTVDIPVLILDSERRIRRFTPKARRILNVLPTDVGRPFEDIRTNIDVADLDHQIAEVIETMAVKEWEVQDRDGHWYRLQIRPYKATDNRIDGAILSLVDIDALKHLVETAQRANTDAERANHTKDEFLATLSHELRTPLASMLMRAQLLRRGDMDEATVRRAGESIESGVRMQVQLIDDLLDVSRIASGKLSMDLAPIDLATTVTRAVEGLSLPIERKSLKFELDLPPAETMGFVNGDDSRLQQVVTNLLNNAIKFTPKLGKVTVSLTVGDGHAVIRVKDSGMGIEAAFLPNVFDRFSQQNSSSTRAYGGLGLGLAIVRHLVELHDGTVLAESPGGGMGATFTVTLPLMKMTPDSVRPPKETQERAALDPALLNGLRILVTDDDRATREVVADMLEQMGADVRLARSAAEATETIEEFRPELLICDVAMPGENGYEFIRGLRALGAGHSWNIPALALTALAREGDRAAALAAGYQIHLAKPVDIDRLTEAVVALAAFRGTRLASPAS
jgi:chemotaxis methyl-accepting protein methylase/signal transduction histidine kinase/chemotaxis response regulator CheB